MARQNRGVTLVLWDVDLTLVRCGPVARDVFDAAVAQVVGRHPGAHGIRMGGKTDPQIAREILAHAGVGEAEAQLPALMVALERGLADVADRLAEGGGVMPGALPVVQRLAAMPSVVQTVLTGNIRPNARLKLAAFGLERWLDLDVGAYGSDSAVRTDLVPIARDRAEQRYGREFAGAQTWVVGDTPLDLACARAGAARCLLVASGYHDYEELAPLGADAVLHDLTGVDEVVDLLTQ